MGAMADPAAPGDKGEMAAMGLRAHVTRGLETVVELESADKVGLAILVVMADQPRTVAKAGLST
jgi:hypothetical protein